MCISNRLVAWLVFLGASLATALAQAGGAQVAETPADPTKAEVPLPALAGWNAQLVHDNGAVGIWAVKQAPIWDAYAVPELIGLDDLGRCIIMVSYSGKWTPKRIIEEGRWLGGLWHGELDPRAEGPELYTGGAMGNLYQIRAYPYGLADFRLIAQFPGMEIHTVVGGELDPRVVGPELLVFTRPGELWRVKPTGEHGTFESERLMLLPGRIRDAIEVPEGFGFPKSSLLTATRAGHLGLVTIDSAGPHYQILWKDTVGVGRLALRTPTKGQPLVLYAGLDDGRIQRFERSLEGNLRVETIYRGLQGTRGVACGRFDADPNSETVAVFGYSSKVQLLRKTAQGWQAETVFVDRDKGHWLSACEVDGRNATDELVASGYGGRMIVLARPPGFGFTDGVPTDPDPAPSGDRDAPNPAAGSQANAELVPAPKRQAAKLGAFAGPIAAERLDPLTYSGGFETKTFVYETLVRRDETGAIVGQLAESWKATEAGTSWSFVLRSGATWSDGTPVTAEHVVWHFRRCAGLPEHAWLRGLQRVQMVSAADERTVVFRLREPWYLPADLCAINPCAVRGPRALDSEGEFVAPNGSGVWSWQGTTGEGTVLQLDGREGQGSLDIVRLDPNDPKVGDRIQAGTLDALADGWEEAIPRAEFAALRTKPGWQGLEHAGSSVWYLSFSLAGPSTDLALRKTLEAAIQREELVRVAESGYAVPCRTWLTPQCSVWPAATSGSGRISFVQATPQPLTLLVASEPRAERLGRALVQQWARAGWSITLAVEAAAGYRERVEQGRYDLRLENTWGLPYDPDLSLQARFLPDIGHPTATSRRDFGVDPVLRQCVQKAASTSSETERSAAFAAFQRQVDEQATIVPLLVPDRLALVRPKALSLSLTSDLYRVQLGPPRAE